MNERPAENGQGRIFRILAVSLLAVEAAIITVTLIVVVWFSGGHKEKKAPEKPARTPVEVLTVASSKVPDILEVPGRVESWTSVQLAAEVDGSVIFVGAEKGTLLQKNALLFKIDDRVCAAKFRKAEADHSNALLHLSRIKKLYESKSVSEKELEDAQNRAEIAAAELSIVKKDLEKCEIRSPISGFLDDRPVDEGEYVSPGRQVATIEEVDRVKIVFAVPERDVMTVRVGQVLDFTIDIIEGRAFSGQVIFYATAANKESLSYRAELEVPNPEVMFRPGMIAKVKIVRRIVEDAIAVPLTAIIPRYGGHYVYVAGDGDKAVLREIKIAFISGTSAVVAGGLKPGDKVVTEGHRFLSENEPLLIVNGK